MQTLPTQNRYVVEVRNKSWLNPEFYSLLRANRVALAWADSSLMAQISEVTADFLYVRWEGDRKRVNGTLGKIEADRQGPEIGSGQNQTLLKQNGGLRVLWQILLGLSAFRCRHIAKST